MNVFLADEQDQPVSIAPLRSLAARVLGEEGLPSDCEVSIVLVDETEIASFNKRFLDRDGPTDVLSFPIEDLKPGRVVAPLPGGPPLNIGDVFICPAVVKDQAAKLGVRFERELALMVVHGILHLLGYDHQEDADAEVMERRERELLALGGVEP